VDPPIVSSRLVRPVTSVDVGLIREAGGLGDVLRLDSVARALKRRGTERVTAYGLHQYKEVFGRLSAIDEFVSVQIRFLSQRRSRSSNWQKADYLMRTIRRGHDRIVDLFCPGYLHEMRSDPPIFSRAEAFCLAAEVEPVPFEDLRPRWEVRPGDTALAENLGLLPQRPTIGLAIQATDPARTYGQQHTLELIKLLRAEGYEVMVIDREQRFSSEHVRMMTGKPLSVVGAVLPHLVGVVAVCSGILHLCGALDVPCVGLFGPTDPEVMCKHYPHHTIVVAEGYESLEGSPCGQPCWFKPHRGWKAEVCRPQGCYWINKIDPESIVAEVMRRGFERSGAEHGAPEAADPQGSAGATGSGS